jgi:catechol 2,3-dioxygenase-like lactoylglutathione lyase family enzyme
VTMEFWHIGILTPDIEKTLDTICAIPGVRRDTWTLGEVEFAPSEMRVGVGGRLKTAMGRVCGIVYELIQPMDKYSYHAQELKIKGPCIHHTAYVCEDNLDAAVASIKAAGGRTVWEAQHGSEHVYYLEPADGSSVWELINCCPFIPKGV